MLVGTREVIGNGLGGDGGRHGRRPCCVLVPAMDPRSAAHALDQIADLLELRGEDRFRTAAYRNAARAVLDLDTDDLGPLLRSGALAELRGVGPATLGILRELIETGESAFLERLRAETPAGLVEMQRVPGLAASRIYQIYTTLGIDSIDELERAAADGRLATLPRLGPRSAAKIARGIQHLRATRGLMLFPAAATEAGRIRAMVARPGRGGRRRRRFGPTAVGSGPRHRPRAHDSRAARRSRSRVCGHPGRPRRDAGPAAHRGGRECETRAGRWHGLRSRLRATRAPRKRRVARHRKRGSPARRERARGGPRDHDRTRRAARPPRRADPGCGRARTLRRRRPRVYRARA